MRHGSKTFFSLSLLVGLCGYHRPGSAQTAALNLIPQPREVRVLSQIAIADGVSVSVDVAGQQRPEDDFAAKDLLKDLADRGVPVAGSGKAYRVTLLSSAAPLARRLLTEEKMSFEAAMVDEGYVLLLRPHEGYVIGASASGIFYGVETLKQLVQGSGRAATLHTVSIRDWPAMRYRGIDDDLSRGPFPTLAFQKHQVQVFAAYKVNVYSPYFEHTLQYSGNPLPAPPDSAMSKEDVAELVCFAAQYHVTVVPEQEAFGHLHHVLKYEQYSPLAETPHGHVLSPVQPGSIELIRSWFTEIASEFPSPFIHVGADETFELGTGQTKAQVKERGLGRVYAEFLSSIDQALKPLNRKLLFWGDVAMNDPSVVKNLPKDMVAVPWVYGAEKSYDKYILPFKEAGIETWVAPGAANWGVITPITETALPNIQGFLRDGQRLGSVGALTTVWNDDGEELFNQNWYGVLFGAAASWQPGESSIPVYERSFGVLFFGDTTGKIDQALQELTLATHSAVDNNLFWIDPWSQEGLRAAAVLRPKSHEGRLHAERALTLIAQARAANANLHEQDALMAYELAARRIDFVLLKFQLSDEIAESYAKVYAMRNDKGHSSEAQDLIDSISSSNGRCRDLRDGFSMLKNLHRQAWLKENRPYWLDNVLVQYDLNIELWQRRSNAVQSAKNNWESTGVLATATELGIPPPAKP